MKRARLRFEGGRGISNLSYEVHRIVGLSDHPLADGFLITSVVRGFTAGIITASLVSDGAVLVSPYETER